MTIAVDLGRKATKQTNKSTGPTMEEIDMTEKNVDWDVKNQPKKEYK